MTLPVSLLCQSALPFPFSSVLALTARNGASDGKLVFSSKICYCYVALIIPKSRKCNTIQPDTFQQQAFKNVPSWARGKKCNTVKNLTCWCPIFIPHQWFLYQMYSVYSTNHRSCNYHMLRVQTHLWKKKKKKSSCSPTSLKMYSAGNNKKRFWNEDFSRQSGWGYKRIENSFFCRNDTGSEMLTSKYLLYFYRCALIKNDLGV